MAALSTDPCVSCTQHRERSLVRLGLSPDRWDYLIALAGNPLEDIGVLQDPDRFLKLIVRGGRVHKNETA